MTTIACLATNVGRSTLHPLRVERILRDRRKVSTPLSPFPVLCGFDVSMRHRENGALQEGGQAPGTQIGWRASFASCRNDRIWLRIAGSVRVARRDQGESVRSGAVLCLDSPTVAERSSVSIPLLSI